MIPADLIKILAGEFRGVWADYMLLEVGSFVGSNQHAAQKDYRNIYHALKQSMVLDPYFQQTYLLVQGILPWKANMPKEAIALLQVSREKRFWDWRPGHYQAFDYYYFLNDYAEASKVLLETAKIKGTPVVLAILGARFAVKSQQTRAAATILKQMLLNKNLDKDYRLELEERLEALEGVMVLESAVSVYKKRFGHLPPSLSALQDTGVLTAIPKNPYKAYLYDPSTGRVAFDTVK